MNRRLVLLHGWGADGDDLRPLGDALKARLGGSLDLVTLDAPELHPQGSGRQWYGLFPADWDAVPAAVSQLQQRLHQLHGGEPALKRTVLFGFSQGGAMAIHAGCELPLAGVISCSGYPHPNWQPPSGHPPVLLFHGEDDAVVPFEAMAQIRDKLDSHSCKALPFKNGHTIPEETMQPIENFISSVLTELQ